jgi:hypothetical protein
MVHAVIYQEIVDFPYADGHLLQDGKIFLRHVGMPFLDPLVVPAADLVKARPVRNSMKFCRLLFIR